MSEGAPDDPLDHAEGWRYLTRLTRRALESFVEFSDPALPEFRRTASETIMQVVVAHEDSGHPNWLNPCGHRQGGMCWRWIRASEHPQPRTRVVKLESLRG